MLIILAIEMIVMDDIEGDIQLELLFNLVVNFHFGSSSGQVEHSLFGSRFIQMCACGRLTTI